FGILAILFARASLVLSLFITFILLVLIHILAEIAGLVGGGRRPVVDGMLKLLGISKAKSNVQENENP
ncbi:MAG TPA: hypothetical protein VK029_09330, partial [Pseudogracilibacillus sp.]|nr:hypothetical protein [Pseudogracilibacillus sp.]